MNWYYSQNNEQAGPVDISELARLVSAHVISDTTLMWREGMAAWKSLREFKRDASLMNGTGYGFCHESGQLLPSERLVKIGNAYVSAERKDAFVQKLQEGTSSTAPGFASLNYAGFWIRFVAKFVDNIILGVVNMIISVAIMVPLFTSSFESGEPSEEDAAMILMLTGLTYLVSFALGAAYNAFFLPKFGATPGKMITGLKVVRPDGSNISTGQAIGRFFAELLSGLIFLVGYIMAAFDEEKRSLHDRMCTTRVVTK